jgi:hypothetical protein
MFKNSILTLCVTKICKFLIMNVCCIFIFSKKLRHKIRNKAYSYLLRPIFRESLKKYLYILDTKIEENKEENLLKNKIWIVWLQGEKQAPDIIKSCISSIRKNKPENMEVILIDRESVQLYVDLPDYILEKNKKGIISNAFFADIIRTALITKYGGLWLDSTVLLTSSIPEKILNSDFFVFRSEGFCGLEFHSDNWFIYSKNPNELLIKNMRNFLYEYWKNENFVLNYFFYMLFFDLMIENNKILKQEWKKVVNISNLIVFDIDLFEKYEQEKFKNIQKNSIHKLSRKYNKKRSITGTILEFIIKKYN